jgi:CheY-like chemotaxis protein
MNNRYKILIVDDLPENIQTLTKAYEALHPEFILYQATSGKAAFELAKSMKIDLVITDWEMPGMSGIELVKALKAEPGTAHIPVIIISGVMISADDLDIALTAGAYDYLRKPVDKVELAARTNSAIQCVKMHLNELATKNVELTEKTMLLTRNNQFNLGIAKKIKQLEPMVEGNCEANALIRKIQNEIEQNAKEATWRHFEIAFQNVHPEFTHNISLAFPCITPAELKQCILIRLGMNNKDMSSVLFQSHESLKVSRSRIRKKIGIKCETNLQSFLMRY